MTRLNKSPNLELTNEPIHERLYFQSKTPKNIKSKFINSKQKASLLAITGENQTLSQLQKLKTEKERERKEEERKTKEAQEFIDKIKAVKEKQEQK